MGVIYNSVIFFADTKNYHNESFLNYMLTLITKMQKGITTETRKFIP